MTAYFSADDWSVDDLARAAEAPVPQTSAAVDYDKGVPIYDVASLAPVLAAGRGSEALRQLQSEWISVLREGAGVLVLRGAMPNGDAIDRATEAFHRIIAEERDSGLSTGDHFSSGNARIWNSLQKLALGDPQCFVRYHASPAIDVLCEAWLGPGYQMTAQVNLVRPGGAAQKAHRDYHLGFQGPRAAADFPAHMHDLSAVLTLQGALAHCDMPIDSGPTKLLPGSQRFKPGYLLWQRDDYRDYYESHFIQLPLAKGDALFFSPALFHAAGPNVSADIERMANLLQVSSPMGRAMESVDREAMCRALYPHWLDTVVDGAVHQVLHASIACAAEGYSFPTNLDRDPPGDSWVPESQFALVERALGAGWGAAEFESALDAHSARRVA